MIRNTAAKLLARKGEPVTFSYVEGGAYDPLTGGTTGGAPADPITVNAYPAQYNKNEIDGTAIKSGDIRLICEYFEPRPAVGFSVLVDGSQYRVMNVRPVRESGSDIIYICQIRA